MKILFGVPYIKVVKHVKDRHRYVAEFSVVMIHEGPGNMMIHGK